MSVTATATKALEDNKKLLATAAIFETGRIGNNKLGALLADKLPAPMNMLVQTPIGHVIIANILKMAGEQFRPDDEMVKRLTNGMVVAGYTELLQSLDIEGLIDDLMGDRGIKSLLKKQVAAETAAGE